MDFKRIHVKEKVYISNLAKKSSFLERQTLLDWLVEIAVFDGVLTAWDFHISSRKTC